MVLSLWAYCTPAISSYRGKVDNQNRFNENWTHQRWITCRHFNMHCTPMQYPILRGRIVTCLDLNVRASQAIYFIFKDTPRDNALESLVVSGPAILRGCLLVRDFQEQLVSFVQSLSPLNISNCTTMMAIPATALYHAMDRNWLMGNWANITATPVEMETVII